MGRAVGGENSGQVRKEEVPQPDLLQHRLKVLKVMTLFFINFAFWTFANSGLSGLLQVSGFRARF